MTRLIIKPAAGDRPDRPAGGRRAASLLRLAIVPLAAWLAFATMGVPARGETPGDETGGRAADPPARVVRAGGLEFRISISRTANLYHWIDNLAGGSPAKTRDAYLQAWLQQFGERKPEDQKILAAFRDARFWSAARDPGSGARGGCLPGLVLEASARQRLSAAAMSARNVDELARAAADILPARHAESVNRALRRFDARFELLWSRAHDLEPFAASLEKFLARRRTGRMISRMASFYGAELPGGPPVVISLIALPRPGPTHAEADAHHLLIEIPPGDTVDRQVSVVFHELAHDLDRRVPVERRDALARSLFAAGPAGSLAWSLLGEGLPTALGQGVAQVELAPGAFHPQQRWYHRAEIDVFARAVFPEVRKRIRRGGELDATLVRHIVRQVKSRVLRKAPLFALLPESAIATTAAGRYAVEPLHRGLGSWGWLVSWDRPAAAQFVADYPCLPLIVLATRAELEKLPETLAVELRALLEAVPPRADGRRGLIVPGRRRSGSPALLLVAESDAERAAIVRAAGRIVGWPDAPITLPVDAH